MKYIFSHLMTMFLYTFKYDFRCVNKRYWEWYFIFIWYRNYYIFFLQYNPGIGLSCFSPFCSRCSIFYYPYLLFNNNFKFQLLSISCWLDGCWRKNLKYQLRNARYFYPLFSFARLLKFIFTLRSYPSKPSCSIILFYIYFGITFFL